MKHLTIPRVRLLLLLLDLPCAAQNTGYNREAQLDDKGNIFVSSNEARPELAAKTR